MPLFNAVQASPSIGPTYIPSTDPAYIKKREKCAPVQSATCSQTDRVFQDNTSQQKLNFQPHHWLQPEKRMTDYVYTNPCPVKVAPDPQLVIKKYRKMIHEHVERRILFFFQQMIVCHQTKLHFESVGAQDQGRSAKAIVMNVNEHPQKYAVRQAAHSSGNPCLVAYDNTQWEMYQAGKIPKPQGFVFLKDTDYYRTVNATMNMPKWINDADREIDELTAHSLLRSKGEAIINRDAQGLVTPDQGMIEYVQEALKEVDAAQQRLEEDGTKPEAYEVLAYYERYLTKIQRIIETDPLFLEKFLNLKLVDATQNERSKRVILQMRYAAIRNCQINQSILIQKIEKLSQEILTKLKPANRMRKPVNFDAAFKTVLLEHSRTKENRKRLEKLLNFSPFNFEAQLSKSMKTTYLKTKNSICAYNAQINSLVREILEDMRKLRTEETYERAQTIKELRAMKHWTQKELGLEVKKIFPSAAASQSTIGRIERREKLVTEPIAMEFSRVFGVDPGLFMPHFYYE